ncbi:unnamed protein product [Parnassius mnemosyne]|uniref:Uncharacterized protein n=1 Tax=Parnassius mnemosyne TaxID=213953 RepID=A0AAV1KPP3_9NEOP
MPISGCTNGVVATVLVALLFLPVQYYIPDFYASEPEPVLVAPSPYKFSWHQLEDYPLFDTVVAVTLVLLAFLIYICDWIQRKLLERRIIKLNQHLGESMDRLRAWDARQEQLETTLHTVQNATAEYSLLMYLMLRKHRCLGPHKGSPANCLFDKELDNIHFLRSNMLEV